MGVRVKQAAAVCGNFGQPLWSDVVRKRPARSDDVPDGAFVAAD